MLLLSTTYLLEASANGAMKQPTSAPSPSGVAYRPKETYRSPVPALRLALGGGWVAGNLRLADIGNPEKSRGSPPSRFQINEGKSGYSLLSRTRNTAPPKILKPPMTISTMAHAGSPPAEGSGITGVGVGVRWGVTEVGVAVGA